MFSPDIPLFVADFFDFLDSPVWRAWPFNSGYGETMLPAIARMLFVSVIFGVIILFLRFLYGPKGIWRDPELDREADEMRAKQKAELDIEFENGEITEIEYKVRLKGINS